MASLVSLCLPQRESTAAVTRFRDINEIIQIRKSGSQRQLFIHGDIGVGDKQLQGLADWLSENGPHWIIIVLDTTKGQKYQWTATETRHGMDAVESLIIKA